MAINEQKYRNAILFFASHINNSTLGKVKLMKLLYYLDFDHYEHYHTSVTGDKYVHWDMGPVPVSAMDVISHMVDEGELSVTEKHIGMQHPQLQYTPLQPYKVHIFTPSEVAEMYAVCEKWQHHSGSEMVRAVHGEPPWLETDPNAEIDYRLVYRRSSQDSEFSEEEQMNENLSPEDRKLRETGLQFGVQLENLIKTDARFCAWLDRGIEQIETGQTVTFGENGWEDN